MENSEGSFPPPLSQSSDPDENLDRALEVEIIKPVKYENFNSFSKQEKFDIFVEEMVSCRDRPLDVLLEEIGVSLAEYREIRNHPDYLTELHDRSMRERFAPYIPEIYDRAGKEAANGDVAFTKIALQTGGKMGPENLTLINNQLLNMTDKELRQELKFLESQLEVDDEPSPS